MPHPHDSLPCAAAVVVALVTLAALPEPGRAGSIAGTFVETPANTPLAAVEVVVRSAGDSTVAAHATSAGDGRFRLDGLAAGRYLLRASLLGHVPFTRTDVVLAEGAPVFELGTQALAVSALKVDGVTATTARATAIVAPDRNIYLAKDMPAATSGTATDVLRAVPELDVDINGNVSLRGSAGVKIQFNGRAAPMKGEALTTYLRSFPADRIERIEVIANPSAKFDPEGAAGIVNLVLKDNLDMGFSGSTNATLGTRNSGPGAHVGWQQGRLTLYGGGGGWRGRGTSRNGGTRHNLLVPLLSWYETSTSSGYRSDYGTYDGSFDFAFDKRSTLYGTLDGYGMSYTTDPLGQFAILDSAQTDVMRYDRAGSSHYAGRSYSATLGFQHVVERNRNEWSAEYLESNSHNSSAGDGRQHSLVPASTPDQVSRQRGANGYHERSLQVDATRPLTAKARLELGYRGADRRNTNSDDLRYFVGGVPLNTSLNAASDYAHREVFQSGYVTASSVFGKLSVQLGVRGEAAHTVLDVRSSRHSYVHDYRSAFPSANLAWDFGKGCITRLTYSRRVERPWAGMLNPETPSADSLDRSVGNPALGPKYTHSLSLDASWSGSRGSLRLSPYFRETVDNWDRIMHVDAGGIATTTYGNASSIRYAGASVTASLRQVRRLGGTLSLSAYRETHDATNLSSQYRQKRTGWSANGNVMFKTTERLGLQAYLNYSPAQTLAQGRSSAVSFSSVGARYKLGDKASAGLWVSDPFDLYRYELTTRDASYEQEYTYRYKSRGASLSFSWSWGKPPEQKERKQKSDAPQQGSPGPAN